MAVQFCLAFEQNVPNELQQDISEEMKSLRISLMEEELAEVIEAMNNEPIENIAKELADLLYVVHGTIVSYGLQDKMQEVYKEVHRSNMSKLGPDNKPIKNSQGKVQKPDTYSPADIKSVLAS